MSSEVGEKVRVKVDDEVEFLLTQEQLRLLDITSKEGDSFYSCVTSCHENSFEEFDSALSLAEEDHTEQCYEPQYEDITPVPSESETTPTASFAEGTPEGKHGTSCRFPTPSPRKLEAIALVSARFNLIHPPEIKVIPPSPLKIERNDDREGCGLGVSSDISEGDTEAKENEIGVTANEVPDVGEDKLEGNVGLKLPVESDEDNRVPCADENSVAKRDTSQRLKVERKTPSSRAIRPPTKILLPKETRDSIASEKRNQLDASLDITVMSNRLVKNPRPKKLQEQSFKGSPVHLSKLLTPNKAKVTSKVAEFIRTKGPGSETKGRTTPSLKGVPTASRIPKKCFIQSARVFGKQVVPDNLMKSPKPLITIHKHGGSDKSLQIHINESVYETFEADAIKK